MNGGDYMTLDGAKLLFLENNISFEQQEYANEKEYWNHIMLFPYTKNAKSCKVIAMVIKSNNSNKDLELQFNETNGVFSFEELRFGDYCYEEFDVPEEMLAEDLITHITEVMEGNVAVIVANDLKKKSWLSDACFDLEDDDDVFGVQGFQNAIENIEKPISFWNKIFKSKKQYEIYDWNTYKCIVK